MIDVVIGTAIGGSSWYLSRLARGPDIVWDRHNNPRSFSLPRWRFHIHFFFFWNERLRRLTRLWFLGKMMMIRTMEQCSTRVCSLLMVFNFYYSHWWQDFKFRLLGFFGIDKTPRWCKSLNTSDCRDLLQRQQNWWDESLCLSRLSLTHTHTQERQSNLSKWRL